MSHVHCTALHCTYYTTRIRTWHKHVGGISGGTGSWSADGLIHVCWQCLDKEILAIEAECSSIREGKVAWRLSEIRIHPSDRRDRYLYVSHESPARSAPAQPVKHVPAASLPTAKVLLTCGSFSALDELRHY